MIPKEAIEKAIAGGWRPHNSFDYSDHKITKANKRAGFWLGKNNSTSYLDDYHTALDPSFWQALGKALGYEQFFGQKHRWQREAMKFYKLILTGGSIEAFWKELL